MYGPCNTSMKRWRGHDGGTAIIIIIINIINIVINPLTPGPGSENDDFPPTQIIVFPLATACFFQDDDLRSRGYDAGRTRDALADEGRTFAINGRCY